MNSTIKRGSYTLKNDPEQQLVVLSKILPSFGIMKLGDLHTPVSSRDNIDLVYLNKMMPDIRKYFKCYTIPNKIEATSQAICLLKNLCNQAQVPYDWVKTPEGYIFYLENLNPFLDSYKHKYYLDSIKRYTKSVDVEFLLNLDSDQCDVIVCNTDIDCDKFPSLQSFKSKQKIDRSLWNAEVRLTYTRLVDINKHLDFSMIAEIDGEKFIIFKFSYYIDSILKSIKLHSLQKRRFGISTSQYLKPTKWFNGEGTLNLMETYKSVPHTEYILFIDYTESDNVVVEFNNLILTWRDKLKYKVCDMPDYVRMYDKDSEYPCEEYSMTVHKCSTFYLSPYAKYIFDREVEINEKTYTKSSVEEKTIKTKEYYYSQLFTYTLRINNITKPLKITMIPESKSQREERLVENSSTGGRLVENSHDDIFTQIERDSSNRDAYISLRPHDNIKEYIYY